MDLEIKMSCEINGEPYRIATILNTKYVSEDLIKSSFIGEVGSRVGQMIIGVLRAKKISDIKGEIKELEKMGKVNAGKWIPLTIDYDGELLEPFNVRWKHTDGTLSPIGNGEKGDGDIMVYWVDGKEE